MSHQLRLRRQQAGDTIVEVMLVLAILGFAMGISYATASANLKATRQAQEASEATSIAQTQIEALRSMAPNASELNGQNVFIDTVPFCITSPAPGVLQTNTALSNCLGLQGVDTAPNYAVTVDYCDGSDPSRCNNLNLHAYVVRVTWDDISGQGQDTSTLTYRVYPNEYKPQ